MTKFESSIRQIPYPQAAIFQTLSNLENLQQIRHQIPEDKLKDLTFDRDSVTVSVEPVGSVTLRISEREAPKCIKFEAAQSPLPFNLWIQVLPVTDSTSKMKLTLKADIPFMLKGMVSRPLQDGLEKLADALEQIPYTTK